MCNVYKTRKGLKFYCFEKIPHCNIQILIKRDQQVYIYILNKEQKYQRHTLSTFFFFKLNISKNGSQINLLSKI